LWRAARRASIVRVSTSRAAFVAVVDDDEGMRNAMRRVLEAEGFVTEVFGSAEEFLATDAASHAQCLVLDIHLPGMSGIDLHRRLRSLGRRVPTVFVTAHATRETPGCLVKPFPAETLIQAVSQSINSGNANP
jgi:FixJ family two-component response regulator